MPLRIVGFSGSIGRPSQTRALVDLVTAQAAAVFDAVAATYDLTDLQSSLGAATTLDDLGGQQRAIVAAILSGMRWLWALRSDQGADGGILDLTGVDLYGPLPAVELTEGMKSRQALIRQMADEGASPPVSITMGREPAIIFQEPRLLPWLTTWATSLSVFRPPAPRATVPRPARHYICLVGLAEFENAFPRQLSGGMTQRVGIARALTVQPEILLLDEPLGALEAKTKLTMQEELARVWREEKVTMIRVTHDLEEAIYLADRVLVLPKEGGMPRIIEVGLSLPRDRSEGPFVGMRWRLMVQFGLH